MKPRLILLTLVLASSALANPMADAALANEKRIAARYMAMTSGDARFTAEARRMEAVRAEKQRFKTILRHQTSAEMHAAKVDADWALMQAQEAAAVQQAQLNAILRALRR